MLLAVKIDVLLAVADGSLLVDNLYEVLRHSAMQNTNIRRTR
jgi:hypothetical protein